MQPDLGGRVAVVTGAGHGIGRAYAEALAACGSAVVVADIDEAAAKEVADAIADTGGTSHVAAVDVSERDSTQALAADVRARFGGCHIVVNNAAIYHSMRLDPQLTVDIDYWRKIFSVNLDGPLLVTQALAPMLIEAGWGRVVMQTSIAAYGNGGAYGTSKLALLSLTRGFARELGRHGITVNAIAPGPILTEATEVTVPRERIDAMITTAAVQRMGTVDDLVGMLLFLCADSASWVTAQTLVVDGGITARL